MIESGGGVFEVVADGELVFSKKLARHFARLTLFTALVELDLVGVEGR